MAVPLPCLTALFDPFVTDSRRTYRILEHLSYGLYAAFREANPASTPRIQFFTRADQWLEEILDVSFDEDDEDVYNALYDLSRYRVVSAAAQWLFNPNGAPISSLHVDRVEADLAIQHWIIDCAVLGEAGLNRILGPRLSLYKIQPPCYNDSFPVTNEVIDTPFPELTMLFKNLFAETATHTGSTTVADDDVYHILREIVRLVVNISDVFLASIKYEGEDMSISWELGRFHAGVTQAERAFGEMVRNPFAEVPLRVRHLLATFRVFSATNRLLGYMGMSEANYRSIVDSHSMATLASTVYKWIIESAVSPNTDRDGQIRRAVERRFPSTFTVSLNTIISREFRPLGLPNEMISLMADIEAAEGPSFSIWDNMSEQSLTDIPLEATGPENAPLDVASACDAYTAEDICAICLEKFSSTRENMCTKLNGCGHMLHLQCLALWINSAHEVRKVGCPYCRRDICPSRAVRAIVDDGADTRV
jgi:hypothetical protein